MNIEEYREYCLSKPHATESTPFFKAPDVLVFKVAGKMFTATNIDSFESISIKCDPETIEELRETHSAVIEPSYFSKKHWCFVLMDDTVPPKLVKEWLDTSYDLVVAKLSKKDREGLGL